MGYTVRNIQGLNFFLHLLTIRVFDGFLMFHKCDNLCVPNVHENTELHIVYDGNVDVSLKPAVVCKSRVSYHHSEVFGGVFFLILISKYAKKIKIC